jgi:hypothetical protein
MARLLDTLQGRRRLQLLDAAWRQRRIGDVGIDGAGVGVSSKGALYSQQVATRIPTTDDVATFSGGTELPMLGIARVF